jgi:HK97 family phage major capsid protein
VVRPSMNESRARRAARVPGVESMPIGYEDTPEFKAQVADQDLAERGAAAATEALRALKPSAAALDKYPFAASWSAFLTAIRDDAKNGGPVRRAIRNAMGERIPSEGGFLVPWSLQEKILGLMTSAIVRPRAMYVPVQGLRTGVPFLENYNQETAGQALGGLTFGWVEEAASFPVSNPEFGVTALNVNKAGAYMFPVPNELMADATPFTEVFLPILIAKGLAFFEDDAFIATGTGVGQPQALLNSPAAHAVTRATSDAVVVADLVGMLKGLHPESLPTASWLVSKSAHDQILDLYTVGAGQVWNGSALVTADMPVAPPDWYVPAGSGSGPRILGMPAFVNDHQPAVGDTGDVMLVDLGLYLVGDRGAMEVEVSAKGPGFATDSSAIRIRHRPDGRFWPQSTYTTKTSQVVSPLVVLK